MSTVNMNNREFIKIFMWIKRNSELGDFRLMVATV